MTDAGWIAFLPDRVLPTMGGRIARAIQAARHLAARHGLTPEP